MSRIARTARLGLAALTVSLTVVGAAGAQEWQPTKAVKIIVPFAPAGTTDILARSLQPHLAAALGQPVIVENRAGASGILGADIAAKAPPDGHTFVINISAYMVAGTMQKLPFDPIKDFTPISRLINVGSLLVVPRSSPAKTVAELVAYGKALPGGLSYGSSGAGSSLHLAGAFFALRTGTPATHVPYKGGATALNDLVAAQIHYMFGQTASAAPFLPSGDLRPLATSHGKRLKHFPDIPAVAETPGLEGFDIVEWYAALGPAGLSPAVVARLNKELVAALKKSDVVKRLDDLSAETVGDSPEEFGRFLIAEQVKFTKLVKDANIKMDD
jgi:tripartite-type tricarboxylate transporter receptor subunit TctC